MLKVKCADCGFLTVRDEYNELPCEATPRTRSTGNHQSSNGKSVSAKLFCGKDNPAFPQPEEILDRGMHNPISQSHPNVQAIQTNIECGDFHRYRPGKTPKEHEEMTILEQVRAENQSARQEDLRRQEEWRKEDLQRQEKQRAEDVAWRQEVESGIRERFQQGESLKVSLHWRRVLFTFLISLMAYALATWGRSVLGL